jgi:hypothetical protein
MIRRHNVLALPPMIATMVEQKTYPTHHPDVILLGIENKGPKPLPAVSAQVNIATWKNDIKPILTKNIHGRDLTDIKRNGKDASQKSEKQSNCGAVIASLFGREFKCQVAKDGQIASIMHRTAFPPSEALYCGNAG